MKYDPDNVISDSSKQNKLVGYVHQWCEKLEKRENLESWDQVKQILKEEMLQSFQTRKSRQEKIISPTIISTPKQGIGSKRTVQQVYSYIEE